MNKYFSLSVLIITISLSRGSLCMQELPPYSFKELSFTEKQNCTHLTESRWSAIEPQQNRFIQIGPCSPCCALIVIGKGKASNIDISVAFHLYPATNLDRIQYIVSAIINTNTTQLKALLFSRKYDKNSFKNDYPRAALGTSQKKWIKEIEKKLRNDLAIEPKNICINLVSKGSPETGDRTIIIDGSIDSVTGLPTVFSSYNELCLTGKQWRRFSELNMDNLIATLNNKEQEIFDAKKLVPLKFMESSLFQELMMILETKSKKEPIFIDMINQYILELSCSEDY